MYTVWVSIAIIGVVHGPLLLREKPMLCVTVNGFDAVSLAPVVSVTVYVKV
jgi:hypothetical protein